VTENEWGVIISVLVILVLCVAIFWTTARA
jgi:hypothetical protein